MTTLDSNLTLQIESHILHHDRIAIQDIVRFFKQHSQTLVRSTVSFLILENEWCTICEHGRLWINKQTTKVLDTHSTIQIAAKHKPIVGDWVVVYNRNNTFKRLYFDGHYDRDKVRYAFAKIENVLFAHTNAQRYKTFKPIKTMLNFE